MSSLFQNKIPSLLLIRAKFAAKERSFEKNQKEEDVYWSIMVNGVYVDGRKDSTLRTIQNENNTYSKETILEEHHVVVGELGGFYFTHLTTADEKGATTAKALKECLDSTDLKEKLVVIGTDGTASMTGQHAGFIRSLELLLKNPLQWSICLLHCNELPFRHVFKMLDGTNNSPELFQRTNWKVVRFMCQQVACCTI